MKKAEEAKINTLLADLWQKNLPLLRERLDLLDQAAKTASIGELPEASRIEALNIVHKLSGSLGMFGYQQGTEIARKMEKVLRDPTPKSLATLTSLAKDLRTSLPSTL